MNFILLRPKLGKLKYELQETYYIISKYNLTLFSEEFLKKIKIDKWN